MFDLLSRLFSSTKKKEEPVQQKPSGLFEGMSSEEIRQLWVEELTFALNETRAMLNRILIAVSEQLTIIQENLGFILKELPNVSYREEGIKELIEETCHNFQTSIVWDIRKEIDDGLRDLSKMSDEDVMDPEHQDRDVIANIDLAATWSDNELEKLHQIADHLFELREDGETPGAGDVLLIESLTNMQNARNRIGELRDGLYRTLRIDYHLERDQQG